MRTFWGRLTIAVGAILLIVSGVVIFWGNDAAHRIPIGVDNFTRLEGTGQGLLAKSATPVPITNVTRTQSDPDVSTDDVVAMQQISCVALGTDFCFDEDGIVNYAKDDPAIVSHSVEKYALDRRTALAVEDQAKYIKDSTAVQPYEGLVSKFPFNTEKKDYQYWDGTLQATTTAKYAGTKKIDGVETYRFNIDVPFTTAEISEGTEGTYESHQVVWVDPVTGAAIDQTVNQIVGLADGSQVLAANLRYTKDTVAANADDAKGNIRLMWLLETAGRWIAPILGIVLVGLGIFLLRRPRADNKHTKERELTKV